MLVVGIFYPIFNKCGSSGTSQFTSLHFSFLLSGQVSSSVKNWIIVLGNLSFYWTHLVPLISF